MGFLMLLQGFGCWELSFFAFGCNCLGLTMPLSDFSNFDSTSLVRAVAKSDFLVLIYGSTCGMSPSLFDYANLGSVMFARGCTRMGFQVSIFHASHLESSSPAQSMAHLNLAFSFFGCLRLGPLPFLLDAEVIEPPVLMKSSG